MPTYKTPGVYVEEISKFPPSVVGVATAIPAFIGFTAKCPDSKIGQPVKVTSMVDFETKFGMGPSLKIQNDKVVNCEYVLYDSIRLFFDNGGSICFVSSIGQYQNADGKFDTGSISVTADLYKSAIKPLERVDDVTLLLFPDAPMLLSSASDLGSIHQAALQHCKYMGDRFAILDPKQNGEKTIEDFRDYTGSEYLQYGAAYYPYVQTTYSKDIPFDEMLKDSKIINAIKSDTSVQAIYSEYCKTIDYSDVINHVKILLETKKQYADEVKKFSVSGGKLQYNSQEIEKETLGNAVNIYNEIIAEIEDKGDLQSAFDSIAAKYNDPSYFEGLVNQLIQYSVSEYGVLIKETAAKEGKKTTELSKSDASLSVLETMLLDEIESTTKEIKSSESKKPLIAKSLKKLIPGYAEIEANYQAEAQIVPPSGAIAGIYAATDNNKGVWQAPANVCIASISDVTESISDAQQETMNVDANTGKSVNAIRYFSGKGIMVWGARTLDGNSNEWRYIPVRRLFNYIEESVQKATQWAVFQSNDANTWVKIQCQIENFLSNLWRDGALAGSTPDKAFYVRVGQDITMTAQDILEGNLIVEIGLAAVRPAEFIILKFSHKLQEA